MKIVIVGTGVAGSVMADMLTSRGFDVLLLEKETVPGGMCKSYYKEGFTYEYGPHILAVHNCSKKSADYLKSKIETVETQLTSGSVINGQLTYYPPSIFSAEKLNLIELVEKEIANLPKTPDERNFETYLISKVGHTLYKLFFESFTKKFWKIEPSLLSSEWAKIRHLGEDIMTKKMFFNNKWCAYPKKDWNVLFYNLLKNKNILYDIEVNRIDFKKKDIIVRGGGTIRYDFLISTMHIDELFSYSRGKLDYAGYQIKPEIIDRKYYATLDNIPLAMTYYPDLKVPHCRVSDYGCFQKKNNYPYENRTIVTYEIPDNSFRLYPFTDEKNETKFREYLELAAQEDSMITFGRMGLYKYLTSDTTVEMAFRAIDYISNWPYLSKDNRLKAYLNIRGNWKN
jgi:UDP-galactopyranose mutase